MAFGLLLPSAASAQSNAPAALPDPGRVPTPKSTDPLKFGQEMTTETPPKSPAVFDPDPNRLGPLPNQFPGATNRLIRPVTISSNAPPQPAPPFNPDPGAMLRAPTPLPAAPQLFRDEVSGKVVTPTPGIAAEMMLPRINLRSSTIQSAPQPPPGNFGYDPLPKDQELPRENTRRNLKLDQKREVPEYSLLPSDYPKNTVPRPDRWKIGFVPWTRYTRGDVEAPYGVKTPMIWDPYRQSLLKGDVPVLGQDIFLNLTASTQTDFEARRLPVPSGVSAATPGQAEFYGQGEQFVVQNNLAVTLDLFKGETAFKPVEWAIHIQPVFNVNYVNTRESGLVSPDPRGVLGGNNNTPPPPNGGIVNPGDLDPFLAGQVGAAPSSYRGTTHTTRTRTFFALQEFFAELHLRDLSDNYDFVAVRAGSQVFNSDFRGFIFNEVNLGYRLFGNYANNRYQYNLALFDLFEKDTNSELNSFDRRDQQVLIANFYWQDFLWKGYTAQWSVHANFDHGGVHYDRNGNIVRPAPVGSVAPHNVNAYYLGWAGDGHIGRWNVSHAFYQALGRDDFNGIAARPVDINAQMAALELSYDRDWIRYKASVFYASGDSNADDGKGRGFDTIVDNPNFTGGPFSYYVRQGFNLGGSAVNLKQRGSLVTSLRTSKTQGQANFVNPGAFVAGLGADIDVTPKLRAFINANYIRFAETDSLKNVLLTDNVDGELGWDFSLGVQYRPFLTDNCIISAGFGALIPGRGYKDIYRRNTQPVPTFDPPGRAGEVPGFLYSGVLAINLTY
ncbi:MAG: hypothetical protein HY301_13600 [Verrucomicrobia bacterium]|nr:hypothetical protein [Verrucomicrobiota bacterium]